MSKRSSRWRPFFLGSGSHRQVVARLAAAAGLVSTSMAQAGSFYWTGDHDNNWNSTGGANGTNWSSSSAFNSDTQPNLPGSADNVFFVLAGAGNLTNQLGQDFSINSLTFTPDAVSPVTIGGTNLLTLGAGGLADNAPANITLNTNVAIGATQTWANNSTAPLVVGGVLSGTANLTLGGTGANSGTATGVFDFTNANTYSGQITLKNAQSSLTINGGGSFLNVSNTTAGITLLGGSSLVLDNASAGNSSARLASTLGITSLGGTISLLGNSSAATSQTLGTLTLGSGQTNISVTPGSGQTATLTFGSPTATSFSRTTGSTVNFSSTGTIATPNVVLDTGSLIGSWATIGKVGASQQDSIGASNVLDFATVSGGNVVAATNYVNNNATADFVAGNNVKVGTAGSTTSTPVTLNTGTTTVNSLYLTGASSVIVGTVNSTTAGTLVITNGGIICNAATQTLGGSGPQIQMTNSAELGSGVVNTGSGTAGGSITGTITTPSGDLVVTTASNLRIDSVIANDGSSVVNLTKDGSGTLDLSDGNGTAITSTYTGITTINGGLLTIKGDNNLGAGPSANQANNITLNGGELRMFATITLNSHRGITVGPQGGTISYNGGNTTVLSSYQVTGSGSIQYSCIPGFGGVSTNLCAINIDYPTGANNYQGATTFFTSQSTNAAAINAVIYFALNNEVPSTSPVTVTNNDGKGVLNLFGTTQTFGSLAGNGNILNGTATVAPLTVGGDNLSTTYSGNLGKVGVLWNVGANSHAGADNTTGSTAAITLTKVGTGTMTLSGTNGYTGATAINGGALLVTGSLAATPVTVGNSTLAGSLGGSGTIAGTVNVTSTGTLAPAVTPTTTNTLTINNNLTLAAGATLSYNFGAAGSPGTGDNVTVSGAGNAVLSTGTDVLNITPLSGFGIGTYNLISVTGTGTLTDNATFMINGSTLFNYAVAQASNNLVLTVTPGNPNLFWTGAVSGTPNGNWDTMTANWTGASSTFATADNVTFDDTDLAAGGATSITVASGGVSPNSMTFNNVSNNYTFGGGAITVTAAAGIVKNQAGSVTFNDTVTTPLTNVVGGTLSVGSTGTLNSTTQVKVEANATLAVNGSLNTPLLTVLAGATGLNVGSTGSLGATTALVVNAPATFNNATQTVASLGDTLGATSGTVTLNGTALTVAGTSQFDGVISGSGSLTVNNGATFTLTNANLYSNGTTLSGGTLVAKNTSGSATGTGAVAVNSGGTLGGSGSIGGPVTVASSGNLQPGVASGGVATTLTINNTLTLNSGSILTLALNGSPPGDLVQVNGNLTLAAGTDTLNVKPLGFGPGVGTYELMAFTGTLSDNATFTINGLGSDTASVLTPSQSGGVAGELVLNIASVPAITWTGAAGTSGAGTWDTTSTNWTGTTQLFSTGSAVTFDNTGMFPGVATTVTVVAGGVAPGNMTFNNGTIPGQTATPYIIKGGPIGGSGSLTLTPTAGQVTLAGANSFSGGVNINGGQLLVENNTGAGSGPVAVNGALLSVGSTGGALTIANPITLTGGTIGTVQNLTGSVTLSGMLTAASGTTSTIEDFDPVSGTYSADDILITGSLAGSGTIIVPAVPTNPRDNTGVRFRGSGSTFSGTIMVQNSTKFELQVNGTTGSPIGTGNAVFQAGTYVGPTTQGTFPIVNIRNSSGGNAAPGNNFTVTGTGAVFFNQLTGAAGSTSTWGNLKVGGSGVTQSILTGANAVALQTMIFPTVTTEGGSVTFSSGVPGNTDYVDPDNFSLGPIAEDATVSPTPSTSLTFNSTSTVTLTGANTYTGSTTLTAGSLVLGAAGALPAGTALTVNGGTMDLNNGGTSNNQTVASLSGSGGIITNSDAVNTRTFTVAQSTNTTYSGAINGNLALTKSNGGTLILAGTSAYTGPTTISGGILSVTGSTGTSTVTVNSAASLAGSGTVGGTVNVAGGGNLAPSAGLTAPIGHPLTITGPATLTGTSTYSVILASPTAGANPTGYDQVDFASTMSLGGATLVLNDAAYIASGNPMVGDQFWIMDGTASNTAPGQLTGLFAQGATITGGSVTYSIGYDVPGDPDGSGNDVLLTVTGASVPEPASIGLVALGSLGLLARRRRRVPR